LQEYEGVSLNALLDQAGVQPGATTLVFTATDGYTVEVALSDVRACPNSLVAFGETPGEFNVILPDLPTNTWAKQLARIEVK
jgi:DMSO/TMAO reductase YedYZ molybdopterin-dependent catalytic subunit